MTIHIGAKPGEIAPTVLLPGDPLRARYIAETLLEGAACFNEVRGMLGYTGTYKGKRVSVMGTGMGIPSHSIYVHELIIEYHVRQLIRVGTCGGLLKNMKMGHLILAMSASTDSQVNKLTFQGRDYAPIASFELLSKAWQKAKEEGLNVSVGGIFSSDSFYNDDADWWKIWAEYGILGVEMETAALYTLAAKFKVAALSILTVGDNIITGERTSSEERERGFTAMAKLALEIA